MKIKQYWQSVSEDIEIPFHPYHLEESNNIITTSINGVNKSYQRTTCYGGSNFSDQDALANAHKKIQAIKDVISGKTNFLDYEIDIREELVYKLNEQNIITRNRYGALVLNTTDILFIDIDSPKNTFIRFIKWIFNSTDHLTPKALMLEDIQQEIYRNKYRNYAFRVYETFKGYRIAVSGAHFDPTSKLSHQILSDFNSDYLYKLLCKKQECYRARLTPKPLRINYKDLKSNFPHQSQFELERLQNWVKIYDEKSEKYASCKFIFELRKFQDQSIIGLHDKITNALINKPLA